MIPDEKYKRLESFSYFVMKTGKCYGDLTDTLMSRCFTKGKFTFGTVDTKDFTL